MDDIIANRYECISVELAWTDETDSPIDLGGRQCVVLDAQPSVLKLAEFTLLNGPQGLTQFFVNDQIASKLIVGRGNWVRLGIRIPGGCLVSLPPIWINVQ